MDYVTKAAESPSPVYNHNPDIEKRYTYHPPKGDQPERYERIRAKAKQLAYLIDELCPGGAEKLEALKYLDLTVMWANADIARNTKVENG